MPENGWKKKNDAKSIIIEAPFGAFFYNPHQIDIFSLFDKISDHTIIMR